MARSGELGKKGASYHYRQRGYDITEVAGTNHLAG